MQHPGVAAVSFTGSSEVGRLVSRGVRAEVQAVPSGDGRQEHPDRDGRREPRAGGRRRGMGGFGTTGQRCTAASRVAVHKKVYKEFLEQFVERVKALKVGDGLDPATDMGPCINETAAANGDEVRGDRKE